MNQTIMTKFKLHKNTLIYSQNLFSKSFCERTISNSVEDEYKSQDINYSIRIFYLCDKTEDLLKSIFSLIKKYIPSLPDLICNRYAEVLEYKEGNFLDTHFDNPYGDITYSPFTTIINLNEDYQGGLYFDQLDFKVEGQGTFVFCPSSFLTSHKVSKIFKGTRYSLVLDINYYELLNTKFYLSLEEKYKKRKDWFFLF